MKLIMFLSCLLMAVATPLFAQSTPVFETSFTYSFLRLSQNLNRHGWVSSAAGNVNRWFGVKGEIGGSYNDFANDDVHSFLAGPQFTVRTKPTVTPWAHFLLGVTRNPRGSFINLPSGLVFISETDSNFAIQPGGGIDVWVHPHFGLRFGADYRRVSQAFGHSDYGRLQAGIVFRIGNK